jgi:hypothetical protein
MREQDDGNQTTYPDLAQVHGLRAKQSMRIICSMCLTREYGRLLHGCGNTNRPILKQVLAQYHVLSCKALKCIAEAAALCLQILALCLQFL